jgi:hypothetical protein
VEPLFNETLGVPSSSTSIVLTMESGTPPPPIELPEVTPGPLPGDEVLGAGEGPGATPAEATETDRLAFTGPSAATLLAVAGIGLVLVGAPLALTGRLRRRTLDL